MQVNEQSVQASARLCDAIKWHPCLYDSKSKVYQMKHAVDAAWRSIANECEDTVANCKFRWRIIRKSFALSVRKYGSKNKHYLQDYLDFLVPHVASIDINDATVNMTGGTGVIEIDEEGLYVEEDDVADDDDDEEGKHEDAEEDDDENEVNDGDEEHNEHDESDDSDTTTAEETLRDKAADKLNRQRKAKANLDSQYADEDVDDRHTGSQTDEGLRQGRRIIRQRKAPKRYLDTDMYGRNLDKQDEKRARRSSERKKSTTLEECDKRKTTASSPLTSLPSKRVEVKLVKPKVTEPTIAVEAKKIKSVEPDKLKPAVSSDKIRFTFVKPDKTSTHSDISGLSLNSDRTTPVLEMSKKPVNRGTQCDNDVPKTMDEEFLDTIKPQMELMNSRQKFNFKKRVYQALMDVFDDGTNFPNKDEIVELPPTGAPRFDTTTMGELRLMRELVHLVQAAKSTPEIMDATDKVVTSLDSSPSPTPPPSTAAAITEKSSSAVTASERKSNSPSLGNAKRSDTLGLPRHILQKVVKVAGSNGGTILAHEGEKRRVYRIYPKGTLPPSVTNSTGPGSATIGTFYVTPPKTTIASSNQSKTASSGIGNAITGKPIMFNGKVVNHLSTSNTTPSSAANANNLNNSVTRHKITVRTQTPSGIVTQRRLSQSGSANTGSAKSLLLQNKNVTSTNPLSKVTPTTIRTVQRVTWEETPKSSSGLSQIQISQPISLNASANVKNNVKSFLESGPENDSPGETSPNTILPDGGDDEDTPGTNTDNGYDPLFIKTKIKNEPIE